jgi:hypothetical protein
MKRNELLKNNHYENIKTTSLKSDFKFRVKKRSEGRNRRLVHPRIQTKSSNFE